MKKIVITGGHLTPALAVIDELQKRGNWEIYFFGRKYAAESDKTPSMEWQIIPKMGVHFIPINAGRLNWHFTRYSLLSILRLPLGFIQSLIHLFRLKPKLIMSFGGYLSAPAVFAGWLLGIPSLTHEQTTVRGLGTRFNSIFAKKILVSWPNTSWRFPMEKVVFTGLPIRREIFLVEKNVWRRLKYPSRRRLIVITGGNQGSHVINMTIKKILKNLLKKYNVFHQVGHLGGANDFQTLSKFRQKLSWEKRRSYRLKKFVLGNEWGTILNKADLVISRAGANTLAELVALGKPAVLIPLPGLFADEQTKNAHLLKQAGLAEIISQDSLTPSALLKTIEKMMKNLADYKRNSRSSKKLIKFDAAKRIVAEIEKID